MNRHLSPLSAAGQFLDRASVLCDPGLALLIFAVVFGGEGCGSSIYQRTRSALPPEPCAQLKLRVEESQGAEKRAEQTIQLVCDRFNQGLSGEAIAPDVDRAEAAVFELERHVASARDAAAHCDGETQLKSEIERLQKRSKNLLTSVQDIRRRGYSADARQLEDLLHYIARP
jgi:hypothetical protein